LDSTSDGVVRVLFVCSGNTCRSPLAAALAARQVEAGATSRRIQVSSAGTGAWAGAPASDGSARAAQRHGLDLSHHRASPLDGDAVQAADLILVMAPHHLGAAERLGGAGKSHLLSAYARGAGDPLGGDPVSDPFGGDDEVYEATFRELDDLVGRAVDRLVAGLDAPGEAHAG
jgi:protein-tyrosine phosphatase